MEDVQEPSSSSVKWMPSRTAREKKIILPVFQCLQRDHPCSKDEILDMCSDYTGSSKAIIYRILRKEKVCGDVQGNPICLLL